MSMTVSAQEDLRALKLALQSHPATAHLPFFSTNDVIIGLAWMLQTDALGVDRFDNQPKHSFCV